MLVENLNLELVIIKNISDNTRPTLKEIERRMKGQPYKRVIQKLREIKQHQSPIKKAKIIGEARALIAVCIDEFWRGLLEVNTAKKNLLLDAD